MTSKLECKPANGTPPNGLPGFLGYQYVILLAAVLAQTAVSTSNNGVPVLASFYQADLRLSAMEVGLFSGAIGFGAHVVAIAAGWITDRFGVRPVLFLGQAVVGLAIVLLAAMPSFGLAIVFALMAGIGHGLGNPAITKAVLYWFPLQRRATAMGIKQTGVPIAGTLAAAILPAVALAFDWRFAMTGLGMAAIAAGVVTFLLYRDSDTTIPQKAGKPLTFAAVRPILRNKNTWLICGLGTALVAGQNCVVTYLILYLKDVQQLTPAVAGGYLALAQMSGLAARVLLGLLSDFCLGGRRKVVMVGCGFLGTAMLSLTATFSADTSGAFLPLVVIGLGMSTIGWNAIWVTMMVESSSVEVAGIALGFGSTLLALGSSIAPAIFGSIVDQTGSYAPAWYALAGLCLLGSVVLSRFGRERPRIHLD
ncbi:MAG: MFS transporter [Chloroflexi bacterium]|nr:MFS transporter [Chloroflexota bacterium]